MIPFLALVRKDLKLFFNDRKAVVVGLLVQGLPPCAHGRAVGTDIIQP